MATTNNIQEDEPRPTAFEKQVQILTAVVECLTKQNQVLEVQLRRKSNYVGRHDTIFQKKTWKIPVLSDETEKDRRAVMPRADWSGRM